MLFLEFMCNVKSQIINCIDNLICNFYRLKKDNLLFLITYTNSYGNHFYFSIHKDKFSVGWMFCFFTVNWMLLGHF